MSWKPRLIEPGDLEAVVDLAANVFGVGPKATPDYRAQLNAMVEPDRTFVVADGGTVVGTGGAFTYDLALPGGGAVGMAGVTVVGVSATHRRRGVLRTLMGAVADQAVERGDAVAGLTASEGGIYRRFGYGVATRFHAVAVARARSSEVANGVDRSPRASGGRVRLVGEDEAATRLPGLWQRHWRRIPGEVSRSDGWWRAMALDPESERDGASRRYVVVHEGPGGQADGFAVYRIKQAWSPSDPGHDLRVEDLAAVDDAVEAELVRFLLEVDLVKTVHWLAPVDLPLRWRLADPRAVHVAAERDHLWLRPLDVARCLASRRYPVEGGLVIEVIDHVRPEVGGRFRLDAGPDGAAAARTTADADVRLDVADLGALLLGGVTWSTMRRAGLVDERRPGAVATADALFRPDRAPYCGTPF